MGIFNIEHCNTDNKKINIETTLLLLAPLNEQ